MSDATFERPLRVLHLLAPAQIGGLERVVQMLATGQRDAGLQVAVVTIVDPGRTAHPFVSLLDSTGVEVETVESPPRAFLRDRRGFREACGRRKPHVVHTHGYRADFCAGASRCDGASRVSTVHGFTGGRPKNRLYERLQLRALRHFDRVAAVSSPLVSKLRNAGLPPASIELVPNAWAGERAPLTRLEARQALRLNDDAIVAGWVGRLSPEKGADLLLKAVSQLSDPPVEVSLIGDGREEARLRRLARQLELVSRVHLHGRVSDAGSLFPAFDMFVLSSRTEGTPIVLFEAMATGIPIVATAVGGVPDVLSEAEALLVGPAVPSLLAAAIREVVDGPDQAAARARAAKSRLSEAYAAEPWVRRYTQMYEELVDTRDR